MKFRALEFRENPISDKRLPWILGLVGAAAAAAGGFWWWESRHVSVTAAVATVMVTVPKGGTLTINPPAGAQWVGSVNTSGIATSQTGGTGTAPIVLSGVSAGGSIALAWTDSSNVPAGGTVTVSVS